eukprot:UN20494
MSGLIATITAQKEVDPPIPLTKSQEDALIAFTAQTFDIEPEQVDADVSYRTTGTVTMDVEGFNEPQTENAIKNVLSDMYDVPIESIDIETNPTTGEIDYSIMSPTAEIAYILYR